MSTATAIKTIAYQSGNVSFFNRSIEFEINEKKNSIRARVFTYYLNQKSEEPFLDPSKIVLLKDSQIYFNAAKISLQVPSEGTEKIVCVAGLSDKKKFFEIINGLQVENETFEGEKLVGITLIKA